MIIGLLEAETLPEKVISNFGSYGDMFKDMLSLLDPSIIFRYYAVDQEQLPKNIHECDGYIITGSRHNAYDDTPWIKNLRDFIKEINSSNKKCLGICFGHQVIAEALGGKTEKSDKGWGIGVQHYSIQNIPSWIPKTNTDFSILVSHQDQVTRLPPKAKLFATNNFCINGGFFMGNHIFTMQGHPEFTKPYLQFLISKRKEILGAELTEKAAQSISKNNLNNNFSHWIYDFFYSFDHKK